MIPKAKLVWILTPNIQLYQRDVYVQVMRNRRIGTRSNGGRVVRVSFDFHTQTFMNLSTEVVKLVCSKDKFASFQKRETSLHCMYTNVASVTTAQQNTTIRNSLHIKL